jgi:hypothetical protein
MSFLPWGGNRDQPISQMSEISRPEYMPVFQSMMNDDNKEIVSITLDNTSMLVNLELYLRGLQPFTVIDKTTGEERTEYRPVTDPCMNEKGVQAVLREVRLLTDKNTILAFIKDEARLNQLTRNAARSIGLLLTANYDEFEIKDTQADALFWAIVRTMYFSMSRGLAGGESKKVYKDTKRVENVSMVQHDQNKRGMFS